MYILHFVNPLHSSADRYLGCCFFWSIMDNAAVTMDKYLSESLFSILWGIYPGTELLGHMVIQFNLLRNETGTALQPRTIVFW